MGAVPLVGGPPMAPLPPLQELGFGISRWRLQGNATSGLRAGGRGHHFFFLPHKRRLLSHLGSGVCIAALDDSVDLCGGGDGRQRGSARGQMQESATLNYHALLSVAGHTVNSSGCLPTPSAVNL